MLEPMSNAALSRLGRRVEAVEKDIGPGSPLSLRMTGTALPKDDPVLVYLALSDERAYRQMITANDAIGSAIRQRATLLLGEGSEVQAADDSVRAGELKDAAVAFLAGIQSWHQVQHDLLHAIWYGWRPSFVAWEPSLRVGGRAFWGARKVRVFDPWLFHQTHDGALIARDGGRDAVYDSPEDQLVWWTSRYGSTVSPYGRSQLQGLWLLHFLGQRWSKISGQAMSRLLGLPKATRKSASGALPASKGAESRAALREEDLGKELAQVLAMLESNNLLVELSEWSLDVIQMPGVSTDLVKITEHFNERFRIAILGQNLTSKVVEGSFAAAQTHNAILRSYLRDDAKWLAGVVNDDLLRRFFAINFPDAEPQLLPRWRPAILEPEANLEATRLYWSMGGVVDAGAYARRFGVPAADEPGAVLQRPQQLGGLAVGGVPRAAEARSRAIPTTGDDDLDSATGAAVDQAAEVLSRHYRDLVDRFERANPDPKAAGPRRP